MIHSLTLAGCFTTLYPATNAAQVADIEQREILLGIIETAQEFNIDIAVISNIYNPIETDEVLITENRIYDMISSD